MAPPGRVGEGCRRTERGCQRSEKPGPASNWPWPSSTLPRLPRATPRSLGYRARSGEGITPSNFTISNLPCRRGCRMSRAPSAGRQSRCKERDPKNGSASACECLRSLLNYYVGSASFFYNDKMSTGEYIEVERYRRDPPPADLESALAVIKRLIQRGANLAIEGRSPRTKHAPTNMIIRRGVGRDEWTGGA